LIRTARMNGHDPEAYLRDVLARIGAHPVNRLDELLPWNLKPSATPPEMATVKRNAP
jgi:transposase